MFRIFKCFIMVFYTDQYNNLFDNLKVNRLRILWFAQNLKIADNWDNHTRPKFSSTSMIYQRLADLKTRRTELQARYDKLQVASQDKWEEAKVAFNEASESFKEGFSRLAALVK